jgi:hypothetical protein
MKARALVLERDLKAKENKSESDDFFGQALGLLSVSRRNASFLSHQERFFLAFVIHCIASLHLSLVVLSS